MPFDVRVYRILWYFVTAFSNSLQWDRMGQSLHGREGLLTCTRGIIKTMLVIQTFNFGVGWL